MYSCVLAIIQVTTLPVSKLALSQVLLQASQPLVQLHLCRKEVKAVVLLINKHKFYVVLFPNVLRIWRRSVLHFQ